MIVNLCFIQLLSLIDDNICMVDFDKPATIYDVNLFCVVRFCSVKSFLCKFTFDPFLNIFLMPVSFLSPFDDDRDTNVNISNQCFIFILLFYFNFTEFFFLQVCYYGQHYFCFAYSHDHERWIMYDDKTVKVNAYIFVTVYYLSPQVFWGHYILHIFFSIFFFLFVVNWWLG